ncbi:transglycosylase SLT domain-containing protein [Gordonia westfalica]|uniref:Transglycosylase SLT domain-containing protein n=1 Tax=Gordonia westfalica TaxID=158898 RepID=A0ABU2GUZ5_9ACTN|nr:transglycosylase SLT domain-containing protein [Gordonia westfalica]MDS1115293.1 transglycosylase SLT domain-containing protein [Gordonia westfalica]
MSVEIASGYVTIMPSMRGFRREVNRELNNVDRDARVAGERSGRSMASGFMRGFRSGANFDAEGRDAGSRFGRGFLSGMRTGMVGIAAAFGIVNGAVQGTVRHIGTVATVTLWASRIMRGFAIQVMAGATALRLFAGANLGRLAGWLRTISAFAGMLARDVARATAAILVLSAAARTLGKITRVTRVLGMLTIGVAALMGIASTAGPALAALGAAIATVGSAAGGAAIAGISAFGAAIAGLKLGMVGVGDAFKEMFKPPTGGGGAAKAVDNSKDIARAERNLTKAVEAEKDAQEDVAKARDDARKKLRDLDLQLKGAALSEKDARLALREAKEDLARGGFDTGTERERAVLAVQEAELRLAEVQRENGDLAKEAASTRTKGVEGSDEVVAAQERLRDATLETKDAREALAEAKQPKDVGGDTGGVDKQAEAMAKLSGNAQGFVRSVMGVKPAWDSMQRSVQDSLFDGLGERVQSLASTWLPKLGASLRTVTGGFNQGAKTAADWMNSAQGIPIMSSWLQTSSGMAANMGKALGNIMPGLTSIAAGAGEAFAPMVAGMADSARSLSEFLVKAQQSGQIKTFFVDAAAQIKQVFQNISAVMGPAISAFMQLGRVSSAGLAPGLKSIGQAIREATPGLVQMAERLMPALGQALTNISPLIPGLVQAFTPWSNILAAMAPHIATVLSKLGSLGPILLGLAITVKTITMAMTAYNAVMAISSVAQGVFYAATGRSAMGLRRNTIALASYNVAKGVMNALTWAGAAAMRAFGAALRFAMGPIGLIITAVSLIGAGLVLLYKKNETFRNIVNAVWNGIKNAIGAVWSWLSTTVWPGMQAAFRVIGQVAMWLWQSIILPVWNGIKSAIGVAWTIIQGYFNAWMAVFRVVGAVASWFWRSIIVPVFNGIKAAAQFMWTGISVIFGWFKAGWTILGNTLRAIASAVITPVWNAVKAGADFLWRGVKTIFDWIKAGWNFMATAIRTVWENVIRPAFDAVKAAVGKVGDMFSAVADGIRATWDKIKGYAAAPIRFVVNTVWNNGLLPVWRNLKKFLPIPDAPSPTTLAFAEGGPVPMGKGAKRGKDSVNALLMPDEHVWDVADVKRAGGHGAMYRMRNMVESGKPFTWTPSGIGGASEGGPLQRFAKGGAVVPGARLAPAPGEGGLKPIGQLMKRLIHALWPSIKEIGGYRQDSYPEHPSGRALDVMVGSDKKTGDQVNAWAHANHPKFPLTHSIWQQSMWYPPKMRREAMPDRGSPTQNHMDHPHLWWEEQQVNPNVVPEGLKGYDGMTPEDKKSWLQKKAAEIINGMFGGLRDAVTALFPGGPSAFQNIPKEFTNGMFAKMLEETRNIISKIANPGFWYDKGKGLLGSVTKSIWGGVKSVGGLLRDTGGYLPTGQSVVTNETGKPEAVLNWDQLQDVIKQMEAGATLADALAKVGAMPTDTIPEGAVVFKKTTDLEGVKAVAEELRAKAQVDPNNAKDPKAGTDTQQQGLADSISENLGNLTSTAISDSIRNALGQKGETPDGGEETRAGIIAERFANAAKAAVSEQTQDALGLFSIPDSPSLLNAYNQFIEAKKKHDTAKAGGDTSTYSDGTTGDSTDYSALDPSGQLQYKEEKSQIQDVDEGPHGAPNIKYNPAGGAEQWRPLLEWAIDFQRNGIKKTKANVDAGIRQINTESSGNPGAVQQIVDVNGTGESAGVGLLQFIPSTWAAARDKRFPDDRKNPVANLASGIKHYREKYGVDLTSMWGNGRGWKNGGWITGPGGPRSDSVAMWGSNGEFMVNTAAARRNGPLLEAINSGADYTPVSAVGGGADNSTHFHNPVFRDEREFYEKQSRMQRARIRAMSGGR